jgi:hypothetical protein
LGGISLLVPPTGGAVEAKQTNLPIEDTKVLLIKSKPSRGTQINGD